VFFVISGYLITTILIEDIEKNRFSIVNFYKKRALRILPALFFVTLVCIPLAWIWMLPSEMKDFSRSLIAVNLFASNVFFWQESGYFDSAAEIKPLLHTWSLAVEEQYYALFPIFLLLVWRFGKDKVFWMIVTLAVISLALSEYGWRNHATANFYLPHTRAWEIFAGSIAAFIVQKRRVQGNNLLSFIGLAAIVFALFAYDENTPFPSLYTLVPVVGVVLLVLYADKETLVAKLLSTKVFVGIGLISYSAYLWHQPLLTFYQIRFDGIKNLYDYTFLFAILVVLSLFTYQLVEKPARRYRDLLKARKYFFITFLLPVYGLTFIFYYFVNNTDIIYERYTDKVRNILVDKDINRQFMLKNGFDRYGCFFNQDQSAKVLIEKNCHDLVEGKRNLVLYGDSEAAHYSVGLESFAKEHDLNLVVFTGASCRPHTYQNTPRCLEFLELFETYIASRLKISDIVLIGSNWIGSHASLGDNKFYDVVRDKLLDLKSQGIKIFVVSNTPDFSTNPYLEVSKRDRQNEDQYVFVRDYKESDAIIQRVTAELDIPVFFPTDKLCRATKSNYECLFIEDGKYLFFDTGHLSYFGSRKVVKAMNFELFNILQEVK
jgi:peptidoglycan/LPS O-acetylase OafA/YrhL